jgi:hypothetical protein
VRNDLAGGEPELVVVLGGGHDLAASVRAADPHCCYIRVTTADVAGLMGGQRIQSDTRLTPAPRYRQGQLVSGKTKKPQKYWGFQAISF